MTRALALLAVAAVAAVAPSAASAAPGDTYRGGCQYEAVATASDHFSGVVSVAAVLYSTTGGPAPTATISCVFMFADHSVDVPFTGIGYIAGSQRFDYDGYDALWDICERVRWAGETGYTLTCGDSAQLPPQEVVDAYDSLPLLPSLCETVQQADALTPDDPTVVVQQWTDTVYLGGRALNVCPPWSGLPPR